MEEINKWITKSQKEITYTDMEDYFVVNYLNVNTKITKPHNFYQYYFVSPNSNTDIDYIWYDSLNKYCIQKNPTEKEIFTRLIKYIEKHNLNSNTTDTINITTQKSINEEHDKNTNTDLNLEYYTMKSYLIKMSESDKSLNLEHVENNVKSLYDTKIINNLIISEFLDIWKWSKQTNCVSVEITNNIYIWKLKLCNFDNNDLNNDLVIYGQTNYIDYIEVELSFNNKFYPNYPPTIKILNPPLLNSLSHRISNSKMTQLSYWTPTRNIKFIITRIINILNNFGRVALNEKKEEPSVVVSNMNNNLAKLSSYIDTVKENDEIDNDIDFIKFDMIISTTQKKSTISKEKQENKSNWKSGTGYGSDKTKSSWDPNEYIKLQKEKDVNISKILTKILNDLQQLNNTSDDFKNICKNISTSLLLPYLKQQLKESTLLEMQNRESLFRLLLFLIESLCTDYSIYLFGIKYDGSSLYDVIVNLQQLLVSAMKFDKENEFIQLMAGTFEAIVIPMYENYKKTINDSIKNTHNSLITNDSNVNVNIDIKQLYKQKLEPLRFEYVDILGTGFSNESVIPETWFKNSYVKLFKKEMTNNNWKQCQKRLSVELSSLIPIGQLPIDFEASIFMRVDENNPMIIKALITGPHDTPYENGCFIFDLYTTHKYPQTFTNCWFMNTGGNRLNPNLYNEGKVCLSILGTWSGDKSESWNEKTSSLLQVLVSIQAQILVEEPEFNEPGHESSIGTDIGNKRSKQYNQTVRYYTMCSTIRDLIVNPSLYPHFEQVIREHFKIKKQRVLETCKKWTDEAPITNGLKNKYQEVFNEIKIAIEKL